MTVFRIIAWVLVAIALMLLGADAISTLEAGEPVIRTTAEVLTLLGLEVSPMGEGGASGIANFFLEAPFWSLIGVVGIVLTLFLRPID